MPISSPPICPILLERETDLAALENLLRETVTGGGCRLVLLLGEAGTGKSRLAREVITQASASGFHVLTGGCRERDHAFPLAPIVDALRQRLIVAPDAPPSDAAGALLAELLQALEAPVTLESSIPNFPAEFRKRHLFEMIATHLAQLARQQPLLLVLEDLHWADPTSLELLELLPRRLAGTPVLILGTARADELSPELRHCLTTLRRGQLVVELAVAPLSADGVGRMLAIIRTASPASALVAAVHALTGGNPFFVEELVASLPRHADAVWLLSEPAVPVTVQDAVRRRLEGLPPEAQEVIDLAAVAGLRVNFDVLLIATGLPTKPLLGVLRELIDRQLLVEERRSGDPRLAFRHALTRQAVLARILEPQRRQLHQVIGEALEQAAATGRTSVEAGDLGYHFHAAGVWAKTLAYAAQAGTAAWQVHATIEALTHDRRALAAALASGDRRAAALHQRCGQALALLGAVDDARTHLLAARALARQWGLGDLELAALDDLAGLAASHDYAAAQRWAEEALALARKRGDARREALALNRLGNIQTNRRRIDEGLARHEAALAICTRLNDPWCRADCLDLIGMDRYIAGEIPAARQTFGHAAAMFADLGDPARQASALTSRGCYLAVLEGPCATDASPAACRADARQGWQLSQQLAWRAGEAYALVALACADLGEGAYGAAQQRAATALAIAEDIVHPQWQVIALLALGLVAADLEDLATALNHFHRARDLALTIGAAQWTERLDAWIAYCRVIQGDLTSIPAEIVEADPATFRPVSIG